METNLGEDVKKLMTAFVVVCSLALVACGGSDTKTDEAPAEREIAPATSGGMERGFEEEEAAPMAEEAPVGDEAPAAAEDTPAAPESDTPAPE